MELYTIGFAKKSAREFFESLKKAGVKRMIDIRLLNTSHLAGFAKKEDLEYFLSAICKASYLHLLDLAPTQELLDGVRKTKLPFAEYEAAFQALLQKRRAIEKLDPKLFAIPCCLLCSENSPVHCHRRLVAEAIRKRLPQIEVVHL
ncbi:MAG: DUF488 domain-containing protein [Thermodesulfobacteriota bacterium]